VPQITYTPRRQRLFTAGVSAHKRCEIPRVAEVVGAVNEIHARFGAGVCRSDYIIPNIARFYGLWVRSCHPFLSTCVSCRPSYLHTEDRTCPEKPNPKEHLLSPLHKVVGYTPPRWWHWVSYPLLCGIYKSITSGCQTSSINISAPRRLPPCSIKPVTKLYKLPQETEPEERPFTPFT